MRCREFHFASLTGDPAKLLRALKRKSGPSIFVPSEIGLPPAFKGVSLSSARMLDK